MDAQIQSRNTPSNIEALTQAILRAPEPQAQLYVKYFLWLLADPEATVDDSSPTVQVEADIRALVGEVLKRWETDRHSQ